MFPREFWKINKTFWNLSQKIFDSVKEIFYQVLSMTSSSGIKYLLKINFFSEKGWKKYVFWGLSENPNLSQ